MTPAQWTLLAVAVGALAAMGWVWRRADEQEGARVELRRRWHDREVVRPITYEPRHRAR